MSTQQITSAGRAGSRGGSSEPPLVPRRDGHPRSGADEHHDRPRARRDERPPAGSARRPDGPPRQFHGWLGLAEALDTLARALGPRRPRRIQRHRDDGQSARPRRRTTRPGPRAARPARRARRSTHPDMPAWRLLGNFAASSTRQPRSRTSRGQSATRPSETRRASPRTRPYWCRPSSAEGVTPGRDKKENQQMSKDHTKQGAGRARQRATGGARHPTARARARRRTARAGGCGTGSAGLHGRPGAGFHRSGPL